MSIRRAALTTALLAASVVTGTATATAAPEPAAEPVSFRANLIGDTVVTTLDHASFALAADTRSVTISDTAGRPLQVVPLSFTLDGQRLPLRQQISADGRTCG